MFGSHVKLEGTLSETVKNASESGMTAIQVFLGSPYHLNRRQVDMNDINAINFAYKDKVQVFTHLPYVHNFAGRANMKSFAYDGNADVDQYVTSCVQSVQGELNVMSQLSCTCKGCVLHVGSIGSLKDRKKGCQAVATSINKLNLTSPLLLETMVGRGGVLGSGFEELAYIIDKVDDQENVGVCIDTCHMFADGKYDLSRIVEVDRMFEDFDRELGRNRLRLVHLNDSKVGYGVHQDKHEEIGRGEIWKNDNSALVHLLKHAKSRSVPVVLETSVEDFKTLDKLVKEI